MGALTTDAYTKEQYNAATPTRSGGDVSRIMDDLGQITAHVEQMSAAAARLANELFGPPPPAPAPDAGRHDKHGAGIDAVHAQIDALRLQLGGLHQSMERLQRLV